MSLVQSLLSIDFVPGVVLVAEDSREEASVSLQGAPRRRDKLCMCIHFFFFYCGTVRYWKLRLKINKYTPMCDFIVLYVDQKHRAALLGSLRIS